MHTLTEDQLGWIAGIMDGEGTFAIGRSKRGRDWKYTTDISVGNTDSIMLDTLKQRTKMGNIAPFRQMGSNWKPIAEWSLRVWEQKLFIPLISPYLVGKQEQAILLFEFIGLLNISGISGISESNLSTRRVIYSELAELNKRGI